MTYIESTKNTLETFGIKLIDKTETCFLMDIKATQMF